MPVPAVRPLIAGNWKMNGLKASIGELDAMIAGAAQLSPGIDLLVCPPATLVAMAEKGGTFYGEAARQAA